MTIRKLIVICLFLFPSCSTDPTMQVAAPSVQEEPTYDERVQTVRTDILPPSQLGLGDHQ